MVRDPYRSSQPAQPQSSHNDPSRGAQLRDRAFDEELLRQDYNPATQNRANMARTRGPHLTDTYDHFNRSHRVNESESWSNEYPKRSRDESRGSREYDIRLHYQRVHRAWEERPTRPNHYNRHALRALVNNPLLRDLEAPSSNRRTAPRPRRPIHIERYHDDDESDPLLNTRRLGRSNLQDFNARRPRANPIDAWFDRPHRDEPYDTVGYVGRRSDYEAGRGAYIEVEESGFIDEKKR